MPYKKPLSGKAKKKIAAKQARYHAKHKDEEGYRERIKEKNAVSKIQLFLNIFQLFLLYINNIGISQTSDNLSKN